MAGRHKEIDPQGRRVIILIGVEGSGKTTHAQKLSQELGLPSFGTGDIIRSRKNEEGEIGDAIRQMLANNEYLSPELIEKIVGDRLAEEDMINGAIIDGALRTLKETEDFDKTLEKANKQGFEIDIIYLNASDEFGLKNRLEGENKRPDDTREAILKRQAKFHEDLEERIERAKRRYRFFEIDASKSWDEVHKDILNILKNA
jgi:adenylate kinase